MASKSPGPIQQAPGRSISPPTMQKSAKSCRLWGDPGPGARSVETTGACDRHRRLGAVAHGRIGRNGAAVQIARLLLQAARAQGVVARRLLLLFLRLRGDRLADGFRDLLPVTERKW